MPTYNCHITETITLDIEVEANDWEDAYEKANNYVSSTNIENHEDSGISWNIDIDEEE